MSQLGSPRGTCVPFGRLLSVLAPLAALLSACQLSSTTSRERSLEARAQDLLLLKDYDGAVAAFQQMAAASQTPADRARAQLGVGRAYLNLGTYRKALDALYTARKLCELGPLRGTIEQALGEAAFLNRDYSVARGYLERSLAESTGEGRDRLLVELHVCAVRALDGAAAERYLAQVPKPHAPELREILRAHLEPPVGPSTAPPAVAALPPPAPRTHLPEVPAGPLRVIPRHLWDPRPVRRNVDPMGKIHRITVHHTGGPTFWGRSAAEAADEIRKIQKVHQNENHWADIGYHYIIDRAGRVWQGRPLAYQGAHASGNANRGNIGVVILGNYLHQEITAGQLRTLRKLVAGLCDAHGIPSSRIYTHSEIRDGHTDCPGPRIARVVQELRSSL